MSKDEWHDDFGNPIMIPVHAKALYEVLFALMGEDHLIRELQVTMGLGNLVPDANPIVQLLADYNKYRDRQIQENEHG